MSRKGDESQRKKRRCLRCREMFNSSWVGNRMCTGCIAHAAGHSSAMDPGNTIDGRV